MKREKKFLKNIKRFCKKSTHFLLHKKVLSILVIVSFILVLGTLVVLFNPKLAPNSDIYEADERKEGIFVNENPNFGVQFGKKDNNTAQWIRFESETSDTNIFDPNYQVEKETLSKKLKELFTKDGRLGIEMSLSGVKLSETGNETIVDISDGKLKVEDILGTDNVKTSTELLGMGRILGEEDSEQNISKKTILNKDVWKGVDLEYQILEGIGVKEEIIIRSLESYIDTCGDSETDCEIPLNEFIFDLQLDNGVELHQSLVSIRDNPVGTYYFTDSKGNYLAHFLPCYAFDEGGNKTNNIDFSIEETDVEGLYKIHVILDMDWMLSAERIFPIHIDPSIVHDDSTDFDAGILNRLEDATGPKIQLVEQELTADNHTVALWHMNDASGASVTDSSGNSNTGTATGTTITTGKFGNARSFNGSSDYITVTDSISLKPSRITMEVWIKTSVTGVEQMIIDKYNMSSPYQGYGLWVNSSNKIGCWVGGSNWTTGSITVTDGVWHYVACSYDGTNTYVYVDGKLDAFQAQTASLSYAKDLSIGRGSSPTASGYFFPGLIDEIRISNVARTVEEIKADAQKRSYGIYTSDTLDLTDSVTSIDDLQWTETGVNTGDGETPYSTTNLVGQWDFNETSGTTADNEGSCGASCDGTLTNMTTTGQDAAANTGWTAVNSKWGGGAVMFDGSNDTVVTGSEYMFDFEKTDTFSIETWMKTSYNSEYQAIVSKLDSFTPYSGYELSMNATGSLTFLIENTYPTNALLVWTNNIGFNDENWHHIVVTYAGTSLPSCINIYVDGVNQFLTVGYNSLSASTLNNISLNIGSRNNISYFFHGVIDSTKIYSRALSSSEVLSNYNSTNIEFLTRTSVDGNTWEEWKPTTGETQISALDNTYQYTTNDTDLLSYWPMDEGANDSCSGGQDACDVTSTRHGTATGTTIINGRYKNARYFNGSSDVVLVDDFFFADKGITVEAWIKRKTTGSLMGIVSKGGYSENGEYILRLNAANTISFMEGNGSIFPTSITSTRTITDTEWHFLVATNDFTTARLYLDGVEIGTDTTPKTYAASFNNTAKLSIGAETKPSDNSIGYYFSGAIDEIRLYDTYMSASTVLQHYTDGKSRLAETILTSSDSVIKEDGSRSQKVETGKTPVNGSAVALWHFEETGGSGAYIQDSTVNNNDGTPTGTTSVKGLAGKARSFNGSSYITISASTSLDVGDVMTISAWIKPADTTRRTIYSHGSNGTGGFQFEINGSGGAGSFGTMINGYYVAYTGGGLLKTGEWNHIVYTRTGSGSGTHALYLNGISQTLSVNATYSYTSQTANSLIGERAAGSQLWNGLIDELAIFNTAKTATEVYEMYRTAREYYISKTISSTDISSSSTLQYYIASDRPGTYLESIVGESAYANNVPDANTVGFWRLEEEAGNGAYIQDSSSYNNDGTPTGTTVAKGLRGKARSFDGVDDYINVSSISGLTTGNSSNTVEMWVKPTAIPSTRQWPLLLGDASTGNYIWVYNTDGSLSIGIWNGYVCNVTPIVGVWNYIAGTYDGGFLKCYLNGRYISSTSGSLSLSSTALNVGKAGYSGQAYYSGLIDEIRISNVVRTAEQISQAYEIGSRTHLITIDFGAKVDSSNLITGSGDTNFAIDATAKGLSEKGSGIYEGEKIIVSENYNGIGYMAQGTVSSVNITTGAVSVYSWDSGSTFPSLGYYSVNADIFKWQKEYMDLSNIRNSDVNALTNISFRILDGNEGRNIWIDDISYSSYLSNPSATANVTSTVNRYMQYMAVITTSNTNVTPYLSNVTINYTGTVGPTMDQVMRHGKWFNSSGQKQNFWWAD